MNLLLLIFVSNRQLLVIIWFIIIFGVRSVKDRETIIKVHLHRQKASFGQLTA